MLNTIREVLDTNCNKFGFTYNVNKEFCINEDNGHTNFRQYPLVVETDNKCVIAINNAKNTDNLESLFSEMYEYTSANLLVIYIDSKLFAKKLPLYKTSKYLKGKYQFNDIFCIRGYAFLEINTNDIISFLKSYNQEYMGISNNDIIDFINKISKGNKGISKTLHSFINEIKGTTDDVLNIKDDICWFNYELEKKLMFSLLGKVDHDAKLYRCTTLSSLHRILNDAELSMASITSMNDRTETCYATNYIDSKVKGVIKRIKYDQAEQTECYLMSCFEGEHDKLLMWRLYGDNARGVELCFEQNNNINSVFTLARVRYAKSDGSDNILNFLVKLLGKKVNKQYYFTLRYWNIWQHFFKPYEYKEEKEVRVLYVKDIATEYPKTKWVTDSSTGIIFPIVVLTQSEDTITSFPLTLKSITLGPNCPETETNISNIKILINDYLKKKNSLIQIDPNDIKKSEINSYR